MEEIYCKGGRIVTVGREPKRVSDEATNLHGTEKLTSTDAFANTQFGRRIELALNKKEIIVKTKVMSASYEIIASMQ